MALRLQIFLVWFQTCMTILLTAECLLVANNLLDRGCIGFDKEKQELFQWRKATDKTCRESTKAFGENLCWPSADSGAPLCSAVEWGHQPHWQLGPEGDTVGVSCGKVTLSISYTSIYRDSPTVIHPEFWKQSQMDSQRGPKCTDTKSLVLFQMQLRCLSEGKFCSCIFFRHPSFWKTEEILIVYRMDRNTFEWAVGMFWSIAWSTTLGYGY